MHEDIRLRDVEDGWVAGLEDAQGMRGVGEDDAGVGDAEMPRCGFETGWAGVVPYGLGGVGRRFG